VLRQYVDFAGRARRKEYWMFTLVSVIISLMFGILDGALGTAIPGLPYGLAVLLPGLAVGVRQLHDTGRTPTDQTRRFSPTWLPPFPSEETRHRPNGM
jgi:uncharacterized membrane protein YhaH (DUF805 family)